MMTRSKLWRRFEKKLWAEEPLSYAEARRVFNALYREACALGVFKDSNPLEGLEADLRLAKALNSLLRQ